jgi:hypothetical protein
MSNFEGIKLSIIIVNYKSERYLDSCIASIYSKLSAARLEIVLVNNDSEEGLEKIRKSYPEARIIPLQKNIGFGGASNAGAKEAQGEYLLFLNPDTEIVSADLDAAVEKLAQDGTGILGLKIIDRNGKQQEWTVGLQEVGLGSLIRNNLAFLGESKRQKSIFWVSGAALMMEKKVFMETGGFDESFFLYFEDVDLCKRVRERDKKIKYTDDIIVKHVEGGSQRDKIKQKKDFYASQDYYFKKHFGWLTGITVKVLRKVFL